VGGSLVGDPLAVRATPSGPVVVVPSGGAALRVAGAVRVTVESARLPAGSAAEVLMRDLVNALLRAESLRERGAGFTRESSVAASSASWVTPREVANRTGLTPQAVTAQCRLGRWPGAEQIEGRWRIPTAQLEEICDGHTNDTNNAAA
jgi:hypothetical protein